MGTKKKLDSLKLTSPSKPEMNQSKYENISDDLFSHSEEVGKSPPWTEKQPPLKLKLSRKDVSSEISHFEVSDKKHDTMDAIFGRSLTMQKSISDRSNQPTIMLKNINMYSKNKYEESYQTPTDLLDGEKSPPLRIFDNQDNQLEKSSRHNNDSSEDEIMPQKSRRSKDQITKQERKNTDVEDQLGMDVSRSKDDTSEEEFMPQKSRRSKGQPKRQDRKPIYDAVTKSPPKLLKDSEKTSSKLEDESSEDEMLSSKLNRQKLQVTELEAKVIGIKNNKSQSRSFKANTDRGNYAEKNSFQKESDSCNDQDMHKNIMKHKEHKGEENNLMNSDFKKSVSHKEQYSRKRAKLSELDILKDKNIQEQRYDSSEEEDRPEVSKRLKGQPSRKESFLQKESKQQRPSTELPAEDNSSKLIESATQEEILPQKKKRFKGFLESFKPVPETELTHLSDKRQEESGKVLESVVSTLAVKNTEENKSQDEKANLKNKWLQSLEKRNKGKSILNDPPFPKPCKPSIGITKNQTENEKTASTKENSFNEEPIDSKESNQPRKQDKLSEAPVSESDKSDLQEFNKIEGGSLESVEYHEGRPSLRRGKMIPCPLCGVEYAIASNLQKHIDKDHMEGDDRAS